MYYKGFHGDLNETLFVGNVDEKYKKLVRVSYECLDLAIKEGKNSKIIFVYLFDLILCFTSQSTAMVMSGGSVHLTTLFSQASLTKWLTSTLCTYFHL